MTKADDELERILAASDLPGEDKDAIRDYQAYRKYRAQMQREGRKHMTLGAWERMAKWNKSQWRNDVAGEG